LSRISDELFGIADRLEGVAAKSKAPEVEGPVRSLEAAAGEIGKAWGGSWFGYQSRVYYSDLRPPLRARTLTSNGVSRTRLRRAQSVTGRSTTLTK
jgi:hypothetical protein